MEIPTLDTPRLRLRPWRDSDLDQYATLTADPEVMRFLGGQVLNRAQTWRRMATYVGHWYLRGYGFWIAEERSTDRLIGRIGLWKPQGWPGLEVGWAVARPVWGRGYATEGGRAALDWAFARLGAERVISLIQPANVASIRVAEKLGETFERSYDLDGIEVSIYGVDRP